MAAMTLLASIGALGLAFIAWNGPTVNVSQTGGAAAPLVTSELPAVKRPRQKCSSGGLTPRFTGDSVWFPHNSRPASSRALPALSSACLSDDLTRNLANRLEAERKSEALAAKAQDVLPSLSLSGHFALTLGHTLIDFPSREQAELQAEALGRAGITFQRRY